MSELKDTGGRTFFDTGAQRDSSVDKGHQADIPPCMINRVAVVFEKGARKYERANWTKGIPLSKFHNSATRHILSWAQGFEDEDHLAQAIWNLSCAMQTEEWIKAGKRPAELDDLIYRK
jgi:hypothetical protein